MLNLIKSNRMENFSPGPLRCDGDVSGNPMSPDYILQYPLYLSVLDRYLQLRVKDYNYADHFGGVFYLFIRGMPRIKTPGFIFTGPAMNL
jgi:ATP-dependent exoDNAse (exonuclease V) beta subunit